MTTDKRNIRYSLAFQKQVVSEYAQGTPIETLKTKYGITGTMTISRWIQSHSREGLRNQQIIITTPSEQQRMVLLEQELKQTQDLAGTLALENHVLRSQVQLLQQALASGEKSYPPRHHRTRSSTPKH